MKTTTPHGRMRMPTAPVPDIRRCAPKVRRCAAQLGLCGTCAAQLKLSARWSQMCPTSGMVRPTSADVRHNSNSAADNRRCATDLACATDIGTCRPYPPISGREPHMCQISGVVGRTIAHVPQIPHGGADNGTCSPHPPMSGTEPHMCQTSSAVRRTTALVPHMWRCPTDNAACARQGLARGTGANRVRSPRHGATRAPVCETGAWAPRAIVSIHATRGAPGNSWHVRLRARRRQWFPPGESVS